MSKYGEHIAERGSVTHNTQPPRNRRARADDDYREKLTDPKTGEVILDKRRDPVARAPASFSHWFADTLFHAFIQP